MRAFSIGIVLQAIIRLSDGLIRLGKKIFRRQIRAEAQIKLQKNFHACRA